MCVCACVRTYTHTYIHTRIYRHIQSLPGCLHALHVYMHTQIHVCGCMHTHIHVCIHTHRCVSIHTYIHSIHIHHIHKHRPNESARGPRVCMHTHIHVGICTYMCVSIHTYIPYTYIHTSHTQTQARQGCLRASRVLALKNDGHMEARTDDLTTVLNRTKIIRIHSESTNNETKKAAEELSGSRTHDPKAMQNKIRSTGTAGNRTYVGRGRVERKRARNTNSAGNRTEVKSRRNKKSSPQTRGGSPHERVNTTVSQS